MQSTWGHDKLCLMRNGWQLWIHTSDGATEEKDYRKRKRLQEGELKYKKTQQFDGKAEKVLNEDVGDD